MIDKYLNMKKELNNKLDSYNNSYQKKKYYNNKFQSSQFWFYSYSFFLMQIIAFVLISIFISDNFLNYIESHGFIYEDNTAVFNLSATSFFYNNIPEPDFSLINNVFLINLFFYLSAFFLTFKVHLLKICILFLSFTVLTFSGLQIPFLVFNLFYILGFALVIFSFIPFLYFIVWEIGNLFERKDKYNVGFLYLFRSPSNIKKDIAAYQDECHKNKTSYYKLEEEIDKYENKMIKDFDTMKYVINKEDKENFENILNKFEKESKNKNNYYQILLSEKFNNIVIDNE